MDKVVPALDSRTDCDFLFMEYINGYEQQNGQDQQDIVGKAKTESKKRTVKKDLPRLC